jgi:hypothetical protein
MKLRSRIAILALALVLPVVTACGKKKSTTSAPTSQRTPKPPAPPPPPQPPIRDNSTQSEVKDGVSVRVRLFRSELTPKDPLRIAFWLDPEQTIDTKHPWAREQIDWSEVLPGLRFVVKTPKGKSVELVTADKFPKPWQSTLAFVLHDITLDGTGLTQVLGTLKWKEPKPDLFAEPGKYELGVLGKIQGDKGTTLEIASKPIGFEVFEHGPKHKSLAELEALAADSISNKNLQKLAKPLSASIQDVNGNLWTRFTIEDRNDGYDKNVIEVLLDPAGKELAYDAYTHFTCVAEGTPIATPEGEIAVERLVVGTRVFGYDTQTKQRVVTSVRHVDAAYASRLLRIGRSKLTASHPVFADGSWQLAGELGTGKLGLDPAGRSIVLEPVVSEELSAVYDISVDPPHNYFAGGVLVHNKSAHVPLGKGEPWNGWFHRRSAKKK